MSDHVAGRLLVRGFPRTDDAPWLVELHDVLEALGLRFRLTPSSTRRIRELRSTEGRAAELLDAIWVSTVVLEPTEPDGRRSPQSWWVVERLRQLHPVLAERVALAEARRPATMGSAPLDLDGFGVPA